MKRVLITGATGFIGRQALPHLLDRGYEVHAVSSKPRYGASTGVLWHQADLLLDEHVSELMAAIRPTHLLHFAWNVTPPQYWTSVENLRWTTASINLMQEFAAAGGRRTVMVGTCAEYDWRYGHCCELLTPLAPRTLYGVSKHAVQQVLHAFASTVGLSAAWGRIFHLYGPHEHPDRLVPSVIRALLAGEPARCSHGHQIRDYLYVRDVAEAFVTLLDADLCGPINIASGHPISLRHLIGRIAEMLEGQHLIQFEAVPAPGNDPQHLTADTGRLSQDLGWRPRYDLDSGLAETIAWWKATQVEAVHH